MDEIFLYDHSRVEKYFLYDLVNEEEKEFLAAIYLKVVNVTYEVEK